MAPEKMEDLEEEDEEDLLYDGEVKNRRYFPVWLRLKIIFWAILALLLFLGAIGYTIFFLSHHSKVEETNPSLRNAQSVDFPEKLPVTHKSLPVVEPNIKKLLQSTVDTLLPNPSKASTVFSFKIPKQKTKTTMPSSIEVTGPQNTTTTTTKGHRKKNGPNIRYTKLGPKTNHPSTKIQTTSEAPLEATTATTLGTATTETPSPTTTSEAKVEVTIDITTVAPPIETIDSTTESAEEENEPKVTVFDVPIDERR